MPGPPPTPTHLKLLRGNPGKRRLPTDEPQPLIAETCPPPPSFLNAYAADEWRTVAPQLHAMRLLTRVDAAMLSGYCLSYSRWRSAEEALARMARHDEHTDALLIRADEGVRRNPLIKIAQDAARDMRRFANEFGLTPA